MPRPQDNLNSVKDAELLRLFVSAFARRDELIEPAEQIPAELRRDSASEFDECFARWEPLSWAAPDNACYDLEARLPAPFPPLYRMLITSYRYLRVEVGGFCLLANPPSPKLEGLEEGMFRDALLTRVLLQHGFIQFASAGHTDYDPVCFNIAARTRDGDMQVVRLDHEEILCHERIAPLTVLSTSFRELVQRAVGSS
ncbi:MAG: hypothetical protein ACO1SX_17835 [Actinomycetota bacterium]